MTVLAPAVPVVKQWVEIWRKDRMVCYLAVNVNGRELTTVSEYSGKHRLMIHADVPILPLVWDPDG
jgi:hypothetical protein